MGSVPSLSPGHKAAAPLALRAEKALDLLFDFVHLGKSFERVFGEDLLLIQEDLKGARLTGRDGHAAEMRVEIVQEILRQTGGSGEIASGRAVLDAGVVLVRFRGVGVSHTVSFLFSVRTRSRAAALRRVRRVSHDFSERGYGPRYRPRSKEARG